MGTKSYIRERVQRWLYGGLGEVLQHECKLDIDVPFLLVYQPRPDVFTQKALPTK